MHDRSPPPPPPPRLSTRLIIACLATALALVAAEAVASVVREHAFPFLNVFVADADFGVRLEPGATTATRSREGRVTPVRINEQGFRGRDWTPAPGAAPVPGRVLLLGDSQVFGYGVGEADGVAARLEVALGDGAEVLDAAVPTWGPPEYARILDELAPRFRPEAVVLVANVANDWFEAKVPNRQRTTARDGWAAYRLVGTEAPTWFPLRSFLLGRSHLVLGVREILHEARARTSRREAPRVASAARRLADELPHLVRRDPPHRSRLTRHLLDARDACERHGCRLVTAALPLDVQVAAAEWSKYDTAPVDLSRVRALPAIYLAEAAEHAVPALDLLPALEAASPGAFLPDDYHLSPRGHQTVADALLPLLHEVMTR